MKQPEILSFPLHNLLLHYAYAAGGMPFFGNLHPETTHHMDIHCQLMHTVVSQSPVYDIAFQVEARVIENDGIR
jgi:pyruvate dehydrogenase complex dehydrogenase (E1) component